MIQIMLGKSFESITNRLRSAISQPRDEMDRWERSLRFCYDLSRHGTRQLREDRAPQMAAALAFRTLFGLLPVLFVATMLAKALMSPDEVREFIGSVISAVTDRFGLAEVTISGGAAPGDAGAEKSLSTYLHELIIPYVAELKLAALSWIGVAIVLYAAIGLMVTIEKSFNAITRAPEGRPWLSRVTIYWTILTVSPLAIALTFWLDASFGKMIESAGVWQWLLKVATVFGGFAATWLFMTLIYKLVPNTSVSMKSCLAGAFVAAVLLEIGKRTLGAYLANAVPVSLLWGSLGLPIFMFWVYVMWLVVLFGLEVASILHHLRGRQLQEVEQKRERTGLLEPASILTVMDVIARRFEDSLPTTSAKIASETSLDESAVDIMLQRLVKTGHLHRLDREDEAVVLARPADRIPATELIEIGFALVDESSDGAHSRVLDRLREAQRSLMSSTTLAGLRS